MMTSKAVKLTSKTLFCCMALLGITACAHNLDGCAYGVGCKNQIDHYDASVYSNHEGVEVDRIQGDAGRVGQDVHKGHKTAEYVPIFDVTQWNQEV